MSSYHFVIRSSSERTEYLSAASVTSCGFTDSSIDVLHITPFGEALKQCLYIADKTSAQWLICLDADVVLLPNAYKVITSTLPSLTKNVFEIQFCMLDFLFGMARGGGVHIYRTNYASIALSIGIDPDLERPESSMLARMESLGYPWIQNDNVICTHDFSQYNRDIYRKSFMFSKKYRHISGSLSKYWKSQHHLDYKVALSGLNDGLHSTVNPIVDSSKDYYDTGYASHSFTEKPTLSINYWDFVDQLSFNPSWINIGILNKWHSVNVYYFFPNNIIKRLFAFSLLKILHSSYKIRLKLLSLFCDI